MMMDNTLPQLQEALEKDFALQPAPGATLEGLQKLLGLMVNDLVVNDFERLLGLLYRVDIDERRLNAVIAANPGNDAGMLIAQLIINRQLEKIEARKKYTRPAPEDDGEEKW